MIYTVTFNPSLDYMVQVNEFVLGCLHRTEAEELFVGGKGINVSIVLKRLEVDSIALGFVAGFTGSEIISRLRDMGIASDFITLNQGTSRINIKLKSDSNMETEINGQGPVIGAKYLKQFYEKLECIKDDDILVLSGSVPQSMIAKDNVYSTICKLVKTKKIKLVVDAEGDLLRNTLSSHPFLIKPNRNELGKLFGEELKSEEEIIYCASQLQKEGAVNVLVSMAEEGALLIDEYGRVLRQPAPKGQVINSVGAGDSMIAGFLAGLLMIQEAGHKEYAPEDYYNALKFSVAAGSASTFSSGLPDKKMMNNIHKLMN